MNANWRWDGVLGFGRLVGLAAVVGMGIAACGGGDNPTEEVGSAELAVVNVPTNVHCFSVTAQGAARTAVRSINVMPGQTISTVLTGLPTGQVTFTGSGFPTACSAVTASSVATWISDPVTVNVQTSPVVNVPLILHPNGRGSISADFQDDPACFPLGSMCVADADCCTGTLCQGGVCATPAQCSPQLGACASPSDCCDATESCTGGLCLGAGQCVTNADCPGGATCQANTCVTGMGGVCSPATCVPPSICQGNACLAGPLGPCASDSGLHPRPGAAKPGVCQPSQVTCSPANCPSPFVCQGNVCTALPCDPNLDGGVDPHCPAGTICQGGSCVIPPTGQCSTAADCGSGFICVANLRASLAAARPRPARRPMSSPRQRLRATSVLSAHVHSQLAQQAVAGGNLALLLTQLPNLCPSGQAAAKDLETCGCAGPCASVCGGPSCAASPLLTPLCTQCVTSQCQPQLNACLAN